MVIKDNAFTSKKGGRLTIKYLRFLAACFLPNLLVAFTVNATPRAPDTFLYEGQDYHLYRSGDLHSVYPMEAYFSKFPEKRPKAQGLSHSGLRRGYLAKFEIVNDYLVLSDIEILIIGPLAPETNYPQVSRKSVLDGLALEGKPLRIDWYSGILELVRGELLEEAKWLEPLKYKHYTLLEIKNGKLIDKRTFTYKEYEQFKDKQFSAFKKTETYRKEVEKFTGMGSYLRDRVVDYTIRFLVD